MITNVLDVDVDWHVNEHGRLTKGNFPVVYHSYRYVGLLYIEQTFR
jgi:hypothetical protein